MSTVSRRSFLGTVSGGTILLNTAFTKDAFAHYSQSNMRIKFFCPRWGSEDVSWDAFAKRVKEADYNGVEVALSANRQERQEMLAALQNIT